ncbi:hypothetical protein [Rhizobium sp. RAF56]|uniref:hypothetical protein n=1 Tax=Rhizobium sp. RAF56 TaxID=3233062 RepID=UPI003F9B4E78
MQKIAIFSEGQTEQLFVADIIRFLAAEKNFYITKEKLLGGRRFPMITMAVDEAEGAIDNCDFYFLLVDCGTDGRVVSEISERYNGLVDSGFSTIIGMRDLAPSFKREELDKLLDNSKKYLPTGVVNTLLVVAVMEVEAWFIAENTHFTRIDEKLTAKKILDELSIDVTADAHMLDRPSHELSKIYGLAEISYGKSKTEIERTLGALAMAEYRDEAAFQRAESVKPLFERLRAIFTGPLEAQPAE